MSTPRTDKLVAEIKGWKPQARANNLAFLCRKLERERMAIAAERDRFRDALREIYIAPTDTDGTLTMWMRLIAKEALEKA